MHAKEMAPVYPAPGTTCKLYWAEWPAVTVAEVEPFWAGRMTNAGLTLPPTLMACGEPGASSVRVIVAVRWLTDTGEKVRLIVQAPFAARAAPLQAVVIVKSAAFVPPRTTEEIWSVPEPELVTVRVCGPFVVPSVTVPKETMGGVRVTAGAVGGGVEPVPVS